MATKARSPARRAAASPPAGRREASPQQLAERVKELEGHEREAKKTQAKEHKQRQKELADAKKKIAKELQAASRLVQKGEREATRLTTKADQVEKQAEQAKAKAARQQAMVEESLGRMQAKRHAMEASLHDKMSGIGEAKGRLAHAAFAAKMLEAGVIVAIDGTAEAPVAEIHRRGQKAPPLDGAEAEEAGTSVPDDTPPPPPPLLDLEALLILAAACGPEEAPDAADSEAIAELMADNRRLRTALQDALAEIMRLRQSKPSSPAAAADGTDDSEVQEEQAEQHDRETVVEEAAEDEEEATIDTPPDAGSPPHLGAAVPAASLRLPLGALPLAPGLAGVPPQPCGSASLPFPLGPPASAAALPGPPAVPTVSIRAASPTATLRAASPVATLRTAVGGPMGMRRVVVAASGGGSAVSPRVIRQSSMPWLQGPAATQAFVARTASAVPPALPHMVQEDPLPTTVASRAEALGPPLLMNMRSLAVVPPLKPMQMDKPPVEPVVVQTKPVATEPAVAHQHMLEAPPAA